MTFFGWSYIGILLAFCLAFGLVWNLIVLFCMTELKVPVSRRVQILSYIPWGLSLVSVGFVLFFVLQALVVSVTGRGTILFSDSERAARRVAIALGYKTAKRTGFLRRIKNTKGEIYDEYNKNSKKRI